MYTTIVIFITINILYILFRLFVIFYVFVIDLLFVENKLSFYCYWFYKNVDYSDFGVWNYIWVNTILSYIIINL